MILDSSAVIAILFKEPEAEHLAGMIRDADATAIATPTLVEAAIVAEGRTGPGMAEKLDARGAISVTQRAAYIGRVRALAKGCCEAWLAGEGA